MEFTPRLGDGWTSSILGHAPPLTPTHNTSMDRLGGVDLLAGRGEPLDLATEQHTATSDAGYVVAREDAIG